MENNDNIITQQHLIEEELEAQEYYEKSVYSKRVPRPESPNVSFWHLVGTEATIFAIAALGGMILSGVRTGGLFYILEKTLLTAYEIVGATSNVLSATSLVSSLVAFELFLLGVGFSKGKRKEEVTVNGWGISVAFLVTLSAGVFSGFEILELADNVKNFVNLYMVLVSGVGASLITYFGGENIGFAFLTYERKKKELLDAHRDGVQEWMEKCLKSYFTSTYNIRSKKYQNLLEKTGNSSTQEDDSLEQEESQDEIEEKNVKKVLPHYGRDVRKVKTLDEKKEIWTQGEAFMKNMYPDLSDTQVSRWWKYLEDELIEVGYLERKNQDMIVPPVPDEEEDWG